MLSSRMNTSLKFVERVIVDNEENLIELPVSLLTKY
jgi:hypothetical protein